MCVAGLTEWAVLGRLCWWRGQAEWVVLTGRCGCLLWFELGFCWQQWLFL